MTMTTEEGTTIAQSIVVALCGRRWVCPPVQMVDSYPVTQSGRIYLSGPVLDINSVTLRGKPLVGPFAVHNASVLQLPDAPYHPVGAACGGEDMGTVEVDYVYGTDVLPPLATSAITSLAEEILRASTDPDNCALPERVTTVSRQGVSWTLLDPQDFLQDGRTGIYDVDLAIKTYTPMNARRRARVFLPGVIDVARRKKALP